MINKWVRLVRCLKENGFFFLTSTLCYKQLFCLFFNINSLSIMVSPIYPLLLRQCHQSGESLKYPSFYELPNQSPSFQIFVHILPFYSESSMAPTAFRLFHMADKPFPEHPMPNPLDPCSCPICTPTWYFLRRETACWFCVSNAWHSVGPNKLFEVKDSMR